MVYSSIISTDSINNALLSKVSSTENTQEAEAKQVLLELLKELKNKNILPPPSPADAKFPDLVTREISNGNIRIRVSEKDRHGYSRGNYDPLKNILTVYVKKGSGVKNLSLAERVVLVHELYHAYQDAARLPLKTKSEIEGTAHLLATKYLLISLGFHEPGRAAEKALIEHGEEPLVWYMGCDPKRLKELIETALSSDRKIWDKGCQSFGRFYLKLTILAKMEGNFRAIYKNYYKKGKKYERICFALGPAYNKVRITKEQMDQMIKFRLVLAKASGPVETHKAYSIFMDYWIEKVCVNFEKQIEIYDSRIEKNDGTVPRE